MGTGEGDKEGYLVGSGQREVPGGFRTKRGT